MDFGAHLDEIWDSTWWILDAFVGRSLRASMKSAHHKNNAAAFNVSPTAPAVAMSFAPRNDVATSLYDSGIKYGEYIQFNNYSYSDFNDRVLL